MAWAHALWSGAARAVARASLADWALLCLGVALLLYIAGTWTHGHFRRRGLPCVRPLPFLGNMAPFSFGRMSFNDFVEHLYYRYTDLPLYGIFQFFNPVVFVRDPEVIRMIAVKDFDHFIDHQTLVTAKVDPVMGKNLFALRGQEWRDMRATMSPAFTSSKMRNIFKLVDECGVQLVAFLQKQIENSPKKAYETEFKDFFTRFTSDVIATSAFGLQCDSLGDRDNIFYKMGRDLTKMGGTRSLLLLGFLLSPKLMEILRLPFISPPVRDFFHNLVHDTIKEREKKGIFRPDVLQLLMQARQGELNAEADDEQERVKGARTHRLTDVDVTAQAVIFFFAGFDTVSTLMCYAAITLARHPEVQRRVQAEVDAAARESGGALSYEAVQGMKYMDMVLNEVLRLYPVVPFLNRQCVKDYTVEGKDGEPLYTIRKDEILWLPAYALHMDPQYWPDPKKFDPERFSDENKKNIKPFTYMPFGLGPRICIGSRFALLETKIALAHVLQHFNFEQSAKTPKEIKFKKRDFSGFMEGGCWLSITPRNK